MLGKGAQTEVKENNWDYDSCAWNDVGDNSSVNLLTLAAVVLAIQI